MAASPALSERQKATWLPGIEPSRVLTALKSDSEFRARIVVAFKWNRNIWWDGATVLSTATSTGGCHNHITAPVTLYPNSVILGSTLPQVTMADMERSDSSRSTAAIRHIEDHYTWKNTILQSHGRWHPHNIAGVIIDAV
jgi:hypothetical protein